MRSVYGYNILSVIVVCLSVIGLDVALFVSLNSQQKYKLYRLQILVAIEFFCYFLVKNIWKECECACPAKLHLEKLWKLILGCYLLLVTIGPFTTFYMAKEPSFLGMAGWASFGASIILFLSMFCVGGLSKILKLLKLEDTVYAKLCHRPYKGGICLIFTLLYCSTAYMNATTPPSIVRQRIPIAKLPASMNGMKIALLSDIHLGPTVGFSMMEQAVKITNSIKPDIVVIAGDLTDGTVEQLREAALPLKDLVYTTSSYFVTGNHEYYTSDVENWFDFLATLGFHILHNSNHKVVSKTNTNDWFCMLGTDDTQADIIGYEGHGVNLTKAFAGCDNDHAAILITHSPNVAKRALTQNYPIQLILSGHTHGGQFFPFTILVYFGNAFFTGLYKWDSTRYVYVSQGTFYYGWPYRMGSFPEITDITLIAV